MDFQTGLCYDKHWQKEGENEQMTLIIAEKPELGRVIAAAIPGSGRTEQSVIYKVE